MDGALAAENDYVKEGKHMSDQIERNRGCLTISARPEGDNGCGGYKFVLQIRHSGHQSYGQAFRVHFSAGVSVLEAPVT